MKDRHLLSASSRMSTRAAALAPPVLAALLFASPALTQDRSAEDITRELNGGPATRPAPPAGAPATETPRAETPRTETRSPPPPSVVPAGEAVAPPVPAPSASEADEDAAMASPPASAPAPAALEAAAIAALPFTFTLPEGFVVTAGRPAPDFRVYTIQRGDMPFVMVFTGVQSVYPVYEGREVEAAGRRSVLIEADGRRRAVEHLFTRPSSPREIHVWIASVPTAEDRDLAEAIAQSVDVR